LKATAPAIPIPTAIASGTMDRPTSTPSGIFVCSGRPFSSSTACAEMPSARKNATSAATSRPSYKCGARQAPITT
jgi:hypothetical protein